MVIVFIKLLTNNLACICVAHSDTRTLWFTVVHYSLKETNKYDPHFSLFALSGPMKSSEIITVYISAHYDQRKLNGVITIYINSLKPPHAYFHTKFLWLSVTAFECTKIKIKTCIGVTADQRDYTAVTEFA